MKASPDYVPVFATREATEGQRKAAGIPEGCDDLMVIAMPPLPDPFAKEDGPTSASKRRRPAR